MADATTVVEGKVKYREGKKWKSRWCILKKPSPVADRLHLVLYKDVQEALRAAGGGGGRVKTSLSLDGYCGLESGFEVDREEHVLALLCLKQVILLAFESREHLIQFEVKIRRSLGQDYQYPVRIVKTPSGSRLPGVDERVRLLIHGSQLCLTAYSPPHILQCWSIGDLRRYGALEGRFCFEGGARCGKGAGVHAMQTDQADEMAEILRVNSLGKPSAAAARAAGYRSSQLLEDYSQATAGDSLLLSPAGTPGSESAGGEDGPPPMLMCCQGLPAGDRQGCCKRHSVSITEFHRNSALMFPERFRLMPMEKQEHQHRVAMCDVPLKRKPGSGACSNCKEALRVPEKERVSAASSWGLLSVSALQSSRAGLMVNGGGMGFPEESGGRSHSRLSPQPQTGRRVNSVAGMPRSLDTTVFDSLVNAQVDITKRREALQTLHRQETHLQQEMDLLDQMLQSCHSNTQGEAAGGQPHTDPPTEYSLLAHREGISTLEPPVRTGVPVHVSRKSSSLPPKMFGKKEPGVCASPAKKINIFPVVSEHAAPRESTSRSTAHVKLLYRPHSSAPLPYINLNKSAGDVDSRFPDKFGRNGSDSDNFLRPKPFQNWSGSSLAKVGNIVGVAAPTRCSSETRVLPGQNSLAPPKPLAWPPRRGLDGDDDEGLSISVEKLDDDVLLPPTTHAPPVPYPRQISVLLTTTASPQPAPCPPPTNVPAMLPPLIREPLYSNEIPPQLPPRTYRESPPALPPKGPGLLRRTRLRSSGSGSSGGNNRAPPPVPLRTRSLSVGSEGKFNDYDNHPGIELPSPLPPPPECKKGPVEDTYLPMGSPKNPFRRETSGQSKKEGQTSRPSSLCVTGSPKPRHKNLCSAGPRGNADVLSGYMDMANMFIAEPKPSMDTSWDQARWELLDAKEPPPVAESRQDSSLTTQALPPESNYMEMSGLGLSGLPPQAKRKSAVLKNLEALQTYVSSTNAGETPPRTRSRSNTPIPPSKKAGTPTPTVSREKSKIYTRTGSCSSLAGETTECFGLDVRQEGEIYGQEWDGQRPAMPFTNLKNFEQKHTKPPYVNTAIPAPDVPLPEPPKKEEGFFARLIRRNSKEKSTSQSQENLNAQKNRTSVFERTMSVHVQGRTGEEKSTSRLKLGRRRSASFPNRLSFQETTDTDVDSKSDVAATLPPPLPDKALSPAKKSSGTKALKSPPRPTAPAVRCEHPRPQLSSHSDSVSMQDLTEESDKAPLLQRARSSSRSDMRVLTVLHVQQDPVPCPLTSTGPDWVHRSDSCFLPSKLQDPALRCSKDSFPVDCSRLDVSKTAMLDCSLTDDEKLMELFKHSKQHSVMCDIQEIKSKMILPLGNQVTCPKGKTKEADTQDASPPLIPPKRKPSLLTPVSEIPTPGTLSFSTPSPPTPPQHLAASAPKQDESIYVDMKTLLPQFPTFPGGPALPGGAEKGPQIPKGPSLQAENPAQHLEVGPQCAEGRASPARCSLKSCSCAEGSHSQGADGGCTAVEDRQDCVPHRDDQDDSATLTPP